MRALPLPVQFVLFLALQVALSVGLVFYLSTLSNDNYRVFQRSTAGFVETNKSIESLRRSFAQTSASVEKLVADFHAGERLDVRGKVVELKQLASAIRTDSALDDLRGSQNGAVRNLAGSIERHAAHLIDSAEKLPSASPAQVRTIQQSLMDERREIMVDGFGNLITAANNNLKDTMALIGGSTAATNDQYRTLLIVFIVLQIVLMLAALWFFNRQIRQLADLTERLVEGESIPPLAQQKRHDQIGRLARAIQHFKTTLVSMAHSREQLKAMLKKHDQETLNRRKAEQALSLTASVFDNVQEAVLLADIDGYVTRANPAADRLLKLPPQAMHESPLLNLLMAGSEPMVAPIWNHVLEQGHWQGEIEFERSENDVVIAMVSIQLVGQPRAGKGHVIFVINDYTSIRNREREMIQLAEQDLTTDVYNRHFFVRQGSERIAEAPGQSFAIVIIGLDGFRPVNEALGHNYGDVILREVGNRMSAIVDHQGILARVGGDEFAFFISADNGEDLDQRTREIAELCLEAIRRPMYFDDYHLTLRASAGMCLYPDDGETINDLLKVADASLNQAKAAGGNQVVERADRSQNIARRRFDLQQALEKALGNREMRLAFQPQVALANGQVTGFEVLMRWRHGGQWISPAEFIPIAEETDMIVRLTEWAFTEACKRIREWQRQTGETFSLSINIPPRLLLRDRIEQRLIDITKKAGLPVSAIVLEITESSFGTDPSLLAAQLQRLAMQGFTIAIDDFGTGYSSLSYLSHLPITKLKIDKKFVDDIVEDNEARKLLGSILAMGQTLEFDMVIEGVETEAQLITLKRLDTRMDIQGFVFEAPQNEDFWDGMFIENKAPVYTIPDILPGKNG